MFLWHNTTKKIFRRWHVKSESLPYSCINISRRIKAWILFLHNTAVATQTDRFKTEESCILSTQYIRIQFIFQSAALNNNNLADFVM